MRIRTASIGLQKTRERTKPGKRPVEWLPSCKPVTVTGEFMMSYLKHEHDKRNPSTEVMSGPR